MKKGHWILALFIVVAIVAVWMYQKKKAGAAPARAMPAAKTPSAKAVM
jgi:hypothetical protein